MVIGTFVEINREDKKKEPSSELIALTWLFTVSSILTIEAKAAMDTLDFPAIELDPDHHLKFRFNPAIIFIILFEAVCTTSR